VKKRACETRSEDDGQRTCRMSLRMNIYVLPSDLSGMPLRQHGSSTGRHTRWAGATYLLPIPCKGSRPYAWSEMPVKRDSIRARRLSPQADQVRSAMMLLTNDRKRSMAFSRPQRGLLQRRLFPAKRTSHCMCAHSTRRVIRQQCLLCRGFLRSRERGWSLFSLLLRSGQICEQPLTS
jgi:hypothetical protein